MTESPYALELRNVSKHFGDIVAVDGIDLQVPQGEFFSLLGPSGCGKTTTLRMIAGFEEPTEGTLLLAGRESNDIPPFRRNTNLVFQSYALFPHMTVFENVAFGPRRARISERDVHKRVMEALETVRMHEYVDRLPRSLSGGQRQRVALARAIVNRPAVLLLDEPLGALDLKLRKEMQLELKRIQREVGICFVYVTHDQEEAMTMSDRLAVMNRGRIEQVGSPEEVYHRPATRFVAEFIGEANLLDGTVEAVEQGAPTRVSVAGDTVTTVASCAGAPCEVGDRVSLVLRPEHLHLHRDRPNGVPAMSGRVVEAIFQGSLIRFVIEGPDRRRLSVLDTTASRDQAAPGDAVWVSWLPEWVHAVVE